MPVSTAAAGTTSNARGKPPTPSSATATSVPRAAAAQVLPVAPQQPPQPGVVVQPQQPIALLTPPVSSLAPQAAAAASGGAAEAQGQAAHCKHCEEFGVKGGGGGGGGGSVYWRLHLDRDLLETIISIYPEWFKDCNVSPGAMAEGGPCGLGASSPTPPSSPSSSSACHSGGLRRKSVSSASAAAGAAASAAASSSSASPPPHSPPKAQVDDSPLQKSMDRNKESLKVKLMLRRPINQLVAQGIMPPLKTPPAFHEQRQKLERAKTGDLLKAKIQQRPNRTELVRQHILEADMGHVDPSLAERQRMLKKARLQDTLNDQLSHRPGPLELIQKNILHTEEIIERAVKEGQISFKATCEGHLARPQHPSQYVTFEEDSGGSSEGAAGSPPSSQSTVPSMPTETAIPHSPGLASTTSSLSPLSSVSSPQSVPAPPAPLPPPPPPPPPPPTIPTPPPPRSMPIATPGQACMGAQSQTPVPSPSSSASSTPSSSLSHVSPSPLSAVLSAHKDQVSSSSSKNRKKSKTKSQPKTRTIKFHEYKGPPNAQRNSSSLVSPPPVETSYELLLQQQQLFLQWQLEWQHKYPQIILPAAQKPSDVGLITVTTPSSTITSGNASSSSLPPPTPPPQPPPPTTPIFLQAPSPGFVSSPASIGTAPSPASVSTTSSTPIVSAASISVSSSSSAPSPKDVAALRCLPPKMEDMKVSDLKAELKKRNLPVSGSKPQLIERLRAYAEAAPSAGNSTCVQMGSPPASSPGTPAPPAPPPLPSPASAPQLISQSQFTGSSSSSSQPTIFGMDPSLEDSLPPLAMDSPVVSPSGASMDALSSSSSSPPSPLYIQNKSNPPSAAMTLQVFSPASEMEVDPEAAVVVILAPPTAAASPPASSSAPSPPPGGMKQQAPSPPPQSSASPPLRPPPPPPPLPPPPQQLGQNVVSSSTPAVLPENNIIIGNDIIAQQQKKIKELQRELLRSQFQLQCERQQQLMQQQLASQQQVASQTQPRSGSTAPTSNSTGEVKPAHRLVLQQHIQNKIQQQHLQIQLQQLQDMQLRQKKLQLQLQQQKQAKQAPTTKQPGQQAQEQPQQQATQSARASLAAFLQQQSSATAASNNNNASINSNNSSNNNNNNNSNNNNSLKKGANSQQQKVVLNQLNLLNKTVKVEPLTAIGQKTTGTTPNGVVGHHRTASLPNFFGTTFGSAKVSQRLPLLTVQQGQQQHIQPATMVPTAEEAQKGTDGMESSGSIGDAIGLELSPVGVLKPESPPSPANSPSPSPQQYLITKHPPQYEEATKSLKIKLEPGSDNTSTEAGNSESSSSRNSSGKSVKSQIVDDLLEILIKNGELPPSAVNDPPTPTTPGRSLPQGLIFTPSTTATSTAPIPSPATAVTMVQQPMAQTSHSSFAQLVLPEVKSEDMATDKLMSSSSDSHMFHPFDFVLGADTSPTPLHRVASQESTTTHHEDDHSHSELMPLQNTDELGLNLEALDVMEFDLLAGPSSHPPPISQVDMGPVSPVTPENRGMDHHIPEPHMHNSMPRDEDVDMEAMVGSGGGGDLSEMPMDLDVSDWLDSLIAPTSTAQSGGTSPFHHQSLQQPPQYDPLLSHSHDPFDLFDDAELRMASWDRVDFAT